MQLMWKRTVDRYPGDKTKNYARMTQGPHHVAEKTTTSGPGLDFNISSNSESEAYLTALARMAARRTTGTLGMLVVRAAREHNPLRFSRGVKTTLAVEDVTKAMVQVECGLGRCSRARS